MSTIDKFREKIRKDFAIFKINFPAVAKEYEQRFNRAIKSNDIQTLKRLEANIAKVFNDTLMF